MTFDPSKSPIDGGYSLVRADTRTYKQYRVVCHYIRVTNADPIRRAEYTVEAWNKGDAATVATHRFCDQFQIPWKMSHMIVIKVQ